MSDFIGRRVALGIGKETTRGTVVAPNYWFRHLSLDFMKKAKSIQNESAMNRVEKVNDSALVQEWSEGKLAGKITDIGIGYLLDNIFGTTNSAAHAGETVVYDHTMTINQVQQPPTLTFSRSDPNIGRQHAFGVVSSLEIDAQAGDWVKISADLKAAKGATSTPTVSYVVENEFTSKHITAKLAANAAGITAAPAIKAKSLKLKIDRKAEPYFGFGSTDIQEMYTGAYEITGEVVLIYSDTTYENMYYNNTKQYLQLSMANTDVTIGATSNPTLVFKAPQARITDFGMSNDLDKVVEQTLSFYMEFSVADTAALTAVLTNTKSNYTT